MLDVAVPLGILTNAEQDKSLLVLALSYTQQQASGVSTTSVFAFFSLICDCNDNADDYDDDDDE